MVVKTTPEYIELLNSAVARELQVSIQYMLQHTRMEKIARKVTPENILSDKTTYDVTGEVLKKFAIEEMKHAGMIMERIYYLGSSATTKSAKPNVGKSIKEYAKNGVEAEEEALEMYRKIIDLSGQLGDWESRKMFEKIYSDEEAHLFKFQEYLELNDAEPDGPESGPSNWRKIVTPEYLKMLNKAVAMEISAIVQYTNQHEKASRLAGRKRNTPLETIADKTKESIISDMLKPIFMDEMKHFEAITERIYQLEGESVYNPDPLPQVGNDVNEFLKLDHIAEDDAIVYYRSIINKANELGDITTKKMFEDILMDEEKHYWAFDDYF
jgi:bacterioferritin